MKLILIHGAPAVGKYTVGKELSKLTGYKLAHIHKVYDILEDIFDKKNFRSNWDLLKKIYLDIFEEAARRKLKGLIFTYGDIKYGNFEFIRNLFSRLKKYKTKIYLIHLFCEEKELYKRIKGASRKKYYKTKSSKELKHILSRWDFYSKFPGQKTLSVDNTKLSPKQVAKRIKEYYKFPSKTK